MFRKSRFGGVVAVALLMVFFVVGCPDNKTTTVFISGLLNNFSAPQSQTWPLGVQTVIDKPTTFDLRVWASDSLFISTPPSSEDDMLAWVILSDPFGGHADQYIPFQFTYEGGGWYVSTISRSVLEWTGSSGQLQPAEWSLRVDKRIVNAQLQIGCEVTFTRY